MKLKIGALFAGYGGLDLAVESVIDAEVAWVSEVDAGPSRILAHRYPGIPNHGDVTQIDWTQVDPVDVITGGSPCQDLSHAGKRAGMKDGTRSGLWAAMCDAIETIRPSLVIWENVRGRLSAPAEGGTHGHEPCLCGGPDRRRGLYPPRHDGEHLQGPSLGRDDRAGTPDLAGAPRAVGRNAVPDEEGDGEVGCRMDVAPHERGCRDVPGGNPPLPAPEGTAGRPRRGGADLLARSSEANKRERDLGPGDGRPEAGVSEPNVSPEREGPACACLDCGGCVDAAACEVGPCAFCLDDGSGPSLRALGRVLGDLAEVGYDAAWTGLRAADVGAPHGRWRVFVVAWPGTSADAGSDAVRLVPRGAPRSEAGPHEGDVAERPGGRRPPLLWGSREWRDLTLLPTPVVNDMGASYTPETWDEWTARLKASHGNGNGHGASLSIETLRMLPTPSVADVEGGRKTRSGARTDELLLNGVAAEQRFGDYGPAVARWEAALGRPAPAPTEPTGKDGAHRLSPAFVEWMMGLPDGWVTDPAIWEGMKPSTARNAQLKALGNGVVPQQAAAAIRHLLDIRARSAGDPRLEVAA